MRESSFTETQIISILKEAENGARAYELPHTMMLAEVDRARGA